MRQGLVAFSISLACVVCNVAQAETDEAVTTSSSASQSAVIVNSSRKIPAKAVKTVMSPPSNGFVILGNEGKVYRLSAAVQIRDVDNKLLLPVRIEKKVPVKVLLDSYGAVWRVWILTPEEAAKSEPKANSNSNSTTSNK